MVESVQNSIGRNIGGDVIAAKEGGGAGFFDIQSLGSQPCLLLERRSGLLFVFQSKHKHQKLSESKFRSWDL